MFGGTLGSTNFNTSTGLGYANNPWEGWAICDGRNGTPDLRGRFVVGMSDANPDLGNSQANNSLFTSIGNVGANNTTGAAADPILTTDNIPRHRHTFTFLHRDVGNNYDGAFGWETRHQNATGGKTTPNDGDIDLSFGSSLRSNTGVDAGNANSNDTDFWVGGGNTGDGTNNVADQNELKLNSDPFYPAYYALAYVMRVS